MVLVAQRVTWPSRQIQPTCGSAWLDREKDLLETKKFYADPAYAPTVKKLHAEVGRLREEVRETTDPPRTTRSNFTTSRPIPRRPKRKCESPPQIIFVMADDMGWAKRGLALIRCSRRRTSTRWRRTACAFKRLYAGGPVCSPTRAALLTGRSHDRTGVLSHGYALRTQVKTIAQALKGTGSVTGHFGKWHLNGHCGPGAPIFADDPCSPGAFGFDEWGSVSNCL